MKTAPIEKDAKVIANMITKTDSDLRGNLFLLVAENLGKDSQNFTSSLLKKIAIIYGIK